MCNGHAELCDRRFDEVAYVASHNAMSAATEPGWFLAEQSDSIPVQLDQGVRALLIDVWSGIPAGTVVRTAPGSYDEARAVAEEELGPEVVAAAERIADSVAGQATGTEARFMCHGLCETGSTPFLDTLDQLRGWMIANPDEVVTLFIEDHVDSSLIAADVETAGLLDFVYDPSTGDPWPTLGEMIRSGKRLVVMVEEGNGGSAAPWLVNGFELHPGHAVHVPDGRVVQLRPQPRPRRRATATPQPLALRLHARWSPTPSSSTPARSCLPRAEQCQGERRAIPNFVAVNYVAIGDVYDVVDDPQRRRLGHAVVSVDRAGDVGVPARARLRRALERVVVDADQPEALACSRTPTRSCPSGSRRSSRRRARPRRSARGRRRDGRGGSRCDPGRRRTRRRRADRPSPRRSR